MLYSPTTGLFYDSQMFAGRPLPDDTVEITATRHAQLLDQQANGRGIAAGRNGRPYGVRPPAPTLDQRRATASAAVADEARRRILAVASLERQSNDNALMVVTSMTGGDINAPDVQDALVRRLQVDAIRAASNRLDAAIALMSARQIAALDVASDLHWPAKD